MRSCYGIGLGEFNLILGVDFLQTLGPILWDFKAMRMAFTRGDWRVQWDVLGSCHDTLPGPAVRMATVVPEQPLLDNLLQQFDAVFREPQGLPLARPYDHHIYLLPGAREPQGLPSARPYDHHIHLLSGTAPVASRPYRYPQLQKDELKRQCAAMLQQGIIRPSTSLFFASLLLVHKADGSWRFCIDYRALNAKTTKDKFPIPMVDELLDELHGARFFTKLDLRSGYHQVRMHPDDVAKTAFRTHHGHYEFLVMPLGLSNAPATFRALMNDVLRPYVRRIVLVFFDDIFIYCATYVEHLQHISIVLHALRSHRLHLKRSKCSFGATLVTYLGHVISADGVAMDADKVAAVASWLAPRSARGLRGFLGLAGYYRKFIRDFGVIAAPLTRLLQHDAFSWDDEAEAAFQVLKGALTTGQGLAGYYQKFIWDFGVIAARRRPSLVSCGMTPSPGTTRPGRPSMH
ncbi:hypothetical protein U9M48_036459 [Paspalum notatum var. saurae]|uniref:Reverse transcriptase domain-containing protein n=1 Tax=Paspalum notatum var. saurae TaxID=547442 RepID=A0AAQ3UJ76_PASNO